MRKLLSLFSRGGWFEFGRSMGKEEEQNRIIEIVKSKRWVGLTLQDDETNLIALINGEIK